MVYEEITDMKKKSVHLPQERCLRPSQNLARLTGMNKETQLKNLPLRKECD